MQIYQRYIISNLISIFFVVLFIITGLVWLSQIIKIIPLMAQGIRFLDFINIILLLLPSLLFAILPFATVLAIGILYNKLSYEREIIILNNISLTPLQIIKPAMMVAFSVTILAYIISLYLLPLSTSHLKSKLRFIRDNYASNLIQEKTFTSLSKNTIIYVNEKISAKTLKGIVIFDNSNEKKNIVVFAKSGSVKVGEKISSLDLAEGMRQEIDRDTGHLSKMHFKSLSVALNKYDKCSLNTLDDKCLSYNASKNKDLNEFFLTELLFPDQNLSKNRQMKLKSESYQRLIWPLMTIIIPLIFLSIFMQKPYSRRGNGKITLKAIFASLIIVIIHFIFYNLSSKNIFMGIFCYINIGLFGALSYYLLTCDSPLLRSKLF